MPVLVCTLNKIFGFLQILMSLYLLLTKTQNIRSFFVFFYEINVSVCGAEAQKYDTFILM